MECPYIKILLYLLVYGSRQGCRPELHICQQYRQVGATSGSPELGLQDTAAAWSINSSHGDDDIDAADDDNNNHDPTFQNECQVALAHAQLG